VERSSAESFLTEPFLSSIYVSLTLFSALCVFTVKTDDSVREKT
jgi:hypothetical protein